MNRCVAFFFSLRVHEPHPCYCVCCSSPCLHHHASPRSETPLFKLSPSFTPEPNEEVADELSRTSIYWVADELARTQNIHGLLMCSPGPRVADELARTRSTEGDHELLQAEDQHTPPDEV
ncbi:hypothetical protein RIF29_14876 [Crotalaria pallida]|uniref:Uncharacterized protein n=1 Tax=Crotalaria pallida TaxID=3830 RepID=A0AAN9FKW7_CROPI